MDDKFLEAALNQIPEMEKNAPSVETLQVVKELKLLLEKQKKVPVAERQPFKILLRLADRSVMKTAAWPKIS